jgi:alkylglycerol monooxygenase
MATEGLASGWGDRFQIWLRAPEWRTGGRGNHVIPPVDRATFEKYQAPTPRFLKVYVLANLLVVVTFLVFLLLKESSLSRQTITLGSILILFTVLNWSGLFERKRWAWPCEVVRFIAIAAFFGVVGFRP